MKKAHLPSWFELSKYKNADKLTRLGRYKHLSVRKDRIVFAGSYRDSWQKLSPGKPIPSAEIIKALRLNPLGTDEVVEGAMSGDLIDPLPTQTTLHDRLRKFL
jgi:hypothetical protein